MTLFLDDGDVRLFQGDALEVLRSMPDGSVDCCVTSPPYWGLRDYGTGTWEGGDAECDHVQGRPGRKRAEPADGLKESGMERNRDGVAALTRSECSCGASRVDNQLGLEPTPDEYVANMVEVFREVRRVLRSDGTCWVNMGDSYNAGTSAKRKASPDVNHGYWEQGGEMGDERVNVPGLKVKDLCMVPARLALALQEPYYTGRIKDERDRIWLAAMVEAEGCMFIHRRKVGQSNGQGYVRKTDSFGAGLEVASTDRAIVERCLEIAGKGSIGTQTKDRRLPLHRWMLRSNECRDVIRELYPHFIAKQHEARLLLGCPSSGEDAARAHESLKAIHQGGTPDIDFKPPESMFERGWFLRSSIVWSKLCRTPCPNP